MPSRRGLRLTAVIAASVCVLAIAAGALAFSYPGVRDTALTTGLSPRLARFYPLVFDAVLIVACAAVVTLRGLLRGYAWLAVLVVIGAIAAADTVHAMSLAVPKRPLDATIAIAPWAVLLTGLTLLDAMLRRTPGRRTEAAGPVSANDRTAPARSPESTPGRPAGAAAVPLNALLHDSPPAGARQSRAAASGPVAGASPGRITASPPAAGASPVPATASPAAADAIPARATAREPAADADQPAAVASPLHTGADPAAADPRGGWSREG